MAIEVRKPINDDPDTYAVEYYKIDDHSGLFTLICGFLIGAATVVFGLLLYVWIFV